MHGRRLGFRIARKEAHGDAIIARRRQIDARAGRPVAKQRIGNLDQDARPIAHQRVRAYRAAMIDIVQDFQATTNNIVGF
jgi:hypothetical protein